ncbi:MAG: hypothetical protein M1159_00060 [Candidatus Thermoplasmatota archaeon]|jgi:hypothetical protein|nr:hypothetical protein [Candidatus Thermoplasmatota archaeon]MCL5787471.1 hypothetical protein [Candidatus Thermoplasmatota archaeon]
MNICGLGVSGSYLFRRLTDIGFSVNAFDVKRSDYYIPCGYATNERKIGEYCKRAGISFDDYIISRAENVIVAGDNFAEHTFKSSGLCTFDKNRFEHDLIKDLNVMKSKPDYNDGISLDCSGISRALLGQSPDDYCMSAIEYLSENAKHKSFYFKFYGKAMGYFWEFPMGNRYHVGAGGLDHSDNLRRLVPYQKILVTGRKIRLKPLFENIYKGNIAGTGEAIGCVSPITGEGIIPSLKSADLFIECARKYDNIPDLFEKYAVKIRREFGRYYGLHRMVKNLQEGKTLTVDNIRFARSALNEFREFGVDITAPAVLSHFIMPKRHN